MPYPKKITKNCIITNSNQLWETDLKYGFITGEQRFFFVLSIIDVYDRTIVGYHIGLQCEGKDVFDYTCTELGIEHKRIPCRTLNKNAHIKSYHSILEEKCCQRHEFQTCAEAYQTVSEYISYYNRVRLLSSLQ